MRLPDGDGVARHLPDGAVEVGEGTRDDAAMLVALRRSRHRERLPRSRLAVTHQRTYTHHNNNNNNNR